MSTSSLATMSQFGSQMNQWATRNGWLSSSNNSEDSATNGGIKEQSMSEEWDEMTQLTLTQRLSGFFMALGMGIVFIIIAMSFVPALALFTKKFAFFYSCGSLFCVSSTAFLVGPQKQFKMMFDANRAQAAAGYAASLFMTLISAIYWRSTMLSFIFAGVQIVSVLWYSLSYIPFARQVVGTFAGYAWVILKPVLQILGSVLTSCLKWICSGSSSAGSSSGSAV